MRKRPAKRERRHYWRQISMHAMFPGFYLDPDLDISPARALRRLYRADPALGEAIDDWKYLTAGTFGWGVVTSVVATLIVLVVEELVSVSDPLKQLVLAPALIGCGAALSCLALVLGSWILRLTGDAIATRKLSTSRAAASTARLFIPTFIVACAVVAVSVAL